MSKCPFDNKTNCAHLASKDPIVYACDECKIYKNTHKHDNDPVDGVKLIGGLAFGIILLALFAFTCIEILKYFRTI